MEQIVRTAKQVGTAIRRVRRAKSLTQSGVGSKTRMRQGTISRLETGEADTQLRTLFDVLSALDLEIVIRPRSKASIKEIEDLF
jgi:HTH-type transcriptional regulator/antitoxin HipB|tara:strand:+ start:83 stop:334 length:252 start_codon:yes stop_codon:yes gene_type:complete